MLKIGITGGIGSGKTTVCEIFKKLGIPVYSADEQAKKLVSSDKVLQRAIIDAFGRESFSKGEYNRAYMAQRVFRDKNQLEKLNRLIHPRVAEDFFTWCSHQKQSAYILHEAAILFESGTHQLMDYTILVDAPEEMRIKRILERDRTDREAIRERMRNQWSADKIRTMADYLILNDEKNLILPQILRIHQEILKS